jgi:hypothetical protein
VRLRLAKKILKHFDGRYSQGKRIAALRRMERYLNLGKMKFRYVRLRYKVDWNDVGDVVKALDFEKVRPFLESRIRMAQDEVAKQMVQATIDAVWHGKNFAVYIRSTDMRPT